MDPITIMMGVTALAGVATSVMGGQAAAQASAQQAKISGQISGLDMQVNAQKQQQATLTYQRQQMQTIRNTQLARSMALTSATSQGAQFGSGLSGGLAQIGGQANTDQLNLNQNYQIGQNVFGLDNQIDQLKMQMASVGGQMATDQGIMGIGQGITQSAGAISRITAGFGPSANTPGSTGNPGGTAGILPALS